MQNEGQLLQQIQKQVQTLLQSPPSYMRQISKFSQKLLSFQIKYIYYAVNKIKKIILDQYQPIKKKYLAFRFVKDTLLLASHGFYIIIVIQLLGIVLDVLNQGNRQADNGLGYLIKKIGPRPQVSNAIEIKQLCTTLLQLLTQMMKWCGTHIKLHPYYKIPYTSVFHFYLNQLNKIKNTKVTGLQYFTADNIKTYEQNYLQRQLQVQQESRKQVQFITQAINSYISLPQDDNQHDVGLELLKRIIQTGDSTFIKHIIECLKQLIESEITGYKAVQLTNQLLKVKQIQFFTLVRDELLYSVAYFVLMMNKEKFSQIQQIDLIEILKTVYVWKIFAVKMGIQTDTFEEFFKKMKLEWIFVNTTEYTSKTDKLQQAFEKYKCFLSPEYLANVNREKKTHLKLKDDKKVMTKIQKLVYHKRQQNSKKDSFFDDKPQNNSFKSIKKGSQLDNDKNGLNQPNPQLSNINYKPSLQHLESNSPIKQLRMNPLGQSYQSLKKVPIKSQDLIKFNNSMSNISKDEDRVNLMGRNYDQLGNIYTNREQNDKKSILSRSSRSNKSLKKSLGKMEKASSLGFGVQMVKSSKLINGQGNNDPSEIKRNSQKLNIIKFDDSSSNRRALDHSNLQSDNHPYKDEDSRSKMNSPRANANNESTSIANNRKLLKNQQIIIVEQTIKKPKFAFKKQEIDDDLTQAEDNRKKIPKDIDRIVNRSIQSFKVDPSLVSDDKVSKYSSIPSDFKQVLGGKAIGKNSQAEDSQEDMNLNIKFNKFPHKVKQLQMEIEKAKQFQLLYQQKMRQKDEQYEKILKDLPPSHQVVHEENMKLKKELEQKQRKQAEKQQARQRKKLQQNKQSKNQLLPTKIPFLPQSIYPLPPYTPYPPQFTKQMISTKCLLQKNDIFELGYAFKKQPHTMFNQSFSYKICLYFKILVKCDSMKFKMENGGLLLNEELQARVVNVVANKQMKFQGEVIGYVLGLNRQFQVPKINIQIVPDKEIQDFINQQRNKFKQPCVQHDYQLKIPCSLFNFIEFHTPTKKPQQIRTIYAIQPQQSCSQLANSIKGEFLLNSLKCGRLVQSKEQNCFYVSFHTYFKDVKSKKLIEQSQGDKVYFDKLAKLQRKEVNLVIKKIGAEMFYIQSDNVFQNDKIVLMEICKVIGK